MDRRITKVGKIVEKLASTEEALQLASDALDGTSVSPFDERSTKFEFIAYTDGSETRVTLRIEGGKGPTARLTLEEATALKEYLIKYL